MFLNTCNVVHLIKFFCDTLLNIEKIALILIVLDHFWFIRIATSLIYIWSLQNFLFLFDMYKAPYIGQYFFDFQDQYLTNYPVYEPNLKKICWKHGKLNRLNYVQLNPKIS